MATNTTRAVSKKSVQKMAPRKKAVKKKAVKKKAVKKKAVKKKAVKKKAVKSVPRKEKAKKATRNESPKNQVGAGNTPVDSSTRRSESEPVDPLVLAYHLALARILPVDQLLHLDPTRIRDAAQQVCPKVTGPELPRCALHTLESRQGAAEPNGLWLAWVRTTRGDHVERLARELERSASGSVKQRPR